MDAIATRDGLIANYLAIDCDRCQVVVISLREMWTYSLFSFFEIRNLLRMLKQVSNSKGGCSYIRDRKRIHPGNIQSIGWTFGAIQKTIYLFIPKFIRHALPFAISIIFQNLLNCQPETTRRVDSCFSRLLNLVNEQLSILEFKYNLSLHTIII